MWLYGFAKVTVGFVYRLIYRVEVEGLEHVPLQGGLILCGNHFNASDPVIAGITLPRRVSFMAKEEIFKVPVVGTIARGLAAFPVKRGTADRASLKRALDLLAGGGCLGIFPEGTRSRTGTLQKAEPGTAYMALKSGVTVVPFGITGTYKPFSRIKIRFGEPVRLERFQGAKLNSDVLAEAGHEIMVAIGRLLDPPVILPPAVGQER